MFIENILKATECPKCKSNWVSGTIFDSFKKQRDNATPGSHWYGMSDDDITKKIEDSYAPPYIFYRQIGIELQGHYDGISYVRCPDCNAEFDRFTGKYVGQHFPPHTSI